MKRLALLLGALCCAVSAFAQVQVSDTLYVANNQLAQGRIVISNPAFTTSAGVQVGAGYQTWYIVNGAISGLVFPTVGASPTGVAYSATYYLSSGTPYTETWAVPSSATPLKLQDIRSTSTLTIALTQINVTGQTIGDCLGIGSGGVDVIPCGSGSGITQLTGDVTTALGAGPQAATVAFVGGSSAANVHAAELAANAATNLDTFSTIVKRDASGNFVAATITASLTGVASGNELPLTFTSPLLRSTNTITCQVATSSVPGCLAAADWATFNAKQAAITTGTTAQYLRGDLSLATFPTSLPPSGSASGDLSGTYPGPTVAAVGGSTAANVHAAELAANAATNLDTFSAIVKRDASGNFIANQITAALVGNASTATALAATPTQCSGGQFATGVAASGNANCATPTGGGNVSGPGSSTNGYLAAWNGTSGTLLAAGLPVSATPAASTVVESGAGGTIAAAWVPTLNQNTTGTAANVTGTVAIGNGGTGQTGASAAFNALWPGTALGDTVYGGTSGAGTRLAGNITAVRNFMCQTGTGSASAAPAWCLLASTDIPNNAANTTGNASTATALAAPPTGCSAGQFSTGIAANGNSTCVAPNADGYVTGPGSSTSGYLMTWNGTTGTSAAAGLPVSSAAAANTVVEAGAGGTISTAWLPATTFNAIAPATALGGILYGSGANTYSNLAGPATNGTYCLQEVVTASASVAPTFGTCASGSGTVTSFSSGNLSPLFTTSVATATTTPALSFSLTNAPGTSWFGNAAGTSGTPSYNTATIPAALIPAINISASGPGGVYGILVPAPQFVSATSYTLNAGCSPTAPCTYRVGSETYLITASSTLTLSGSATDTVLVSENIDGTTHVDAASAALTCTPSCTVGTATAFPTMGAAPVATIAVTAGAFAAAPSERRSLLAAENIIQGGGITVSSTANTTTVALDATTAGPMLDLSNDAMTWGGVGLPAPVAGCLNYSGSAFSWSSAYCPPTLQVNGTPLASQTPVNFVNGSAVNGVSVVFSNPSAGQITAAQSGTLLVGGGGTGLSAGVSGGVPCYTATNAMASSALLTQYALMAGAGAGACPAPSSVIDNGTTVSTSEGVSLAAAPYLTLPTVATAPTVAGQAVYDTADTFLHVGNGTSSPQYLCSACTQVVGGKSLYPTNALTDGTDATKQVKWTVSGAATGTSTTLAFAQAGNITLTMPTATGVIPATTTTVAVGAPAAYGNTTGGLLGAATGHGIVGTLTCAAASGSGTAYTCSTAPSFTPATGDTVFFKADVANTGAATLAVDGAAAASIKKQGGGTALVANDLLAGTWTTMTFDGTNWQMEGQSGNAASGGAPGGTSGQLQFNAAGVFGGASNTVVVNGGTNAIGALTIVAGEKVLLMANDTESAAIPITAANVTIECSPGVVIKRTGATTGFNVSGNSFLMTGCTLDGNSQTGAGTGPLVILSGNDGLVTNGVVQNAGVTNPSLASLIITAGARNEFRNITFSGSQADACAHVNTYNSGTATVTNSRLVAIKVPTFAPATALTCLAANQNVGASTTGTRITDNMVVGTTAGATDLAWYMQAVVENPADSNNEASRNHLYATVGINSMMHLFGFSYGTADDNLIDDGGHAIGHALLDLGDFYNASTHGNVLKAYSGSESGIVCIDCAQNTFSGDTIDGVGGGLYGVYIGSSAATSTGNTVTGETVRLAYNAICYAAGANGASMPTSNNLWTGNSCTGTNAANQYAWNLTNTTGGMVNNVWNGGTIQNLTNGFVVGASVTGTRIVQPAVSNVTLANLYSLSSLTTVIDNLSSILLADVPASNLANGSMLFVPDATIANPCAGSGTGAILKQLNGVHVCN